MFQCFSLIHFCFSSPPSVLIKLFEVADGKYGDEVRVWTDLAAIAGIEKGSPYAWLRNLSRPGPPELASATLLAPRQMVNKDGNDACPEAATAGSHFGVFGAETADMVRDATQPVSIKDALVGEASGAPKSVTDENAVTVTTFCAVRLTGRQVYALEALNPTKVRQPGQSCIGYKILSSLCS